MAPAGAAVAVVKDATNTKQEDNLISSTVLSAARTTVRPLTSLLRFYPLNGVVRLAGNLFDRFRRCAAWDDSDTEAEASTAGDRGCAATEAGPIKTGDRSTLSPPLNEWQMKNRFLLLLSNLVWSDLVRSGQIRSDPVRPTETTPPSQYRSTGSCNTHPRWPLN